MTNDGAFDARIVSLLNRISNKDSQALKDLYDATSGKMLGVAMRVIGNRELAEDVLQDAYLKIWRIAQDYRQSLSPPLAWMGLVVRSRALDVLRKNATEKHLGGIDFDDESAPMADDAALNPMDMSLASEQAWALNECLKKIEPKPREVLVLAYYKDMSHGELAKQLSLPLGTVKTWIRRSLDQLRICLARFS
jgi:RNA polymerase sigma factor (sigma-70 family)